MGEKKINFILIIVIIILAAFSLTTGILFAVLDKTETPTHEIFLGDAGVLYTTTQKTNTDKKNKIITKEEYTLTPYHPIRRVAANVRTLGQKE